MTARTKITYTSTSGDLEEFHHHFDTALGRIRAAAGVLHPFYVDGQAVQTREEPLVDRSPIDTSVILARFAAATPVHVDAAVLAARRAQPAWGRWAWRERIARSGNCENASRNGRPPPDLETKVRRSGNMSSRELSVHSGVQGKMTSNTPATALIRTNRKTETRCNQS